MRRVERESSVQKSTTFSFPVERISHTTRSHTSVRFRPRFAKQLKKNSRKIRAELPAFAFSHINPIKSCSVLAKENARRHTRLIASMRKKKNISSISVDRREGRAYNGLTHFYVIHRRHSYHAPRICISRARVAVRFSHRERNQSNRTGPFRLFLLSGTRRLDLKTNYIEIRQTRPA